MSHTIDDLRDALFNTLDRLQGKGEPIELDRAKAINETAQVIINTAKAEIEHLKVTGGESKSRFLTGGADPDQKLPNGVRVVTHRIKG